MSNSVQVTFTPQAMLRVPERWYQWLWRVIRKKPVPVVAPPGTRRIVLETKRPDGSTSRTIIPAALISSQEDSA